MTSDTYYKCVRRTFINRNLVEPGEVVYSRRDPGECFVLVTPEGGDLELYLKTRSGEVAPKKWDPWVLLNDNI